MTAGQATTSVAADDDLGLVATRLVGARRVLVTGLVGASFDEACAACDLAEALGAAIDFGAGDLDRPCGPTIARTGRVTAAPEEMRDRADLVVAWGCDPAAIDPALGALIPPGAVVLRMPPPGLTSVQAARRLHHLLRVGPSTAADAPPDDACATAAAAIGTATCVAILFADDADPLGLEAWAVSCLVQEIAHEKPAFEIAPAAADQAAAAVCSWRYGAAGAIARADRDGGAFLPAEASAKRLIGRRETDCVLAVGRLSDVVERALAEAKSAVAVCRIAADEAALRRLRAEVAARAPGAAS